MSCGGAGISLDVKSELRVSPKITFWIISHGQIGIPKSVSRKCLAVLRWKEVVSEDVDAKHRYQDGDKDDHQIRRKVNQFSEHVFGLNVSGFLGCAAT